MTKSLVVLVTGLSGAGKTNALHIFEDLGFFAVDNIPPALIPRLVELLSTEGGLRGTALVVDCRQEGFFGGIQEALRVLADVDVTYAVLYLEADDATLIRRYKETRRHHPLAPQGSVAEGIALERALLEPVRQQATLVLDTSNLTLYRLRRTLAQTYAADASSHPPVHLVSFGFKHGAPAEADLVLDVRSLPNPHYHPELAPLPGTDARVMAFVLHEQSARRLVGRIEALIRDYLGHLEDDARSDFTVAIGCTGGHHRSVAVVEHLASRLSSDYSPLTVSHRDLEKEALSSET